MRKAAITVVAVMLFIGIFCEVFAADLDMSGLSVGKRWEGVWPAESGYPEAYSTLKIHGLEGNNIQATYTLQIEGRKLETREVDSKVDFNPSGRPRFMYKALTFELIDVEGKEMKVTLGSNYTRSRVVTFHIVE